MIYKNTSILIINNGNNKKNENFSVIKSEELDLEKIKKYDWFFLFLDDNWDFNNFHLSNEFLKIEKTKKIYIHKTLGPAFWIISREELKNIFLLFPKDWFEILENSFYSILRTSYENFTLIDIFLNTGLLYKPTINSLKKSINSYFSKLFKEYYNENHKLLAYLGLIADAEDEVIDYAFDIIENYIDFSRLDKIKDYVVMVNCNITQKFFNRFGFYIC